jgi:PAS domain S-box-containing protein
MGAHAYSNTATPRYYQCVPVFDETAESGASQNTHVTIGTYVFAAIIVAGTIALATSLFELIRTPVARGWFVLVALTVVTGWSTLRMRHTPISFSISDSFTIAAALLYGISAGTVLAVVDVLVMSVRVTVGHGSRMRSRVVFNVAATALAMWLASSTFFILSGAAPLAQRPGIVRDLIGPLAVFALMYFLLNTGFVAVAVARERREAVVSVWKSHLSALWLTYFSGASIAAVLVLMTIGGLVDLRTLVVVLPLLVILHVTYRAALDRMAERLEHHRQVALYAEGLRSTADAVLMIDHDGRVTFVNPAAEALLQCDGAAVVGRAAADIFHVVDPQTRRADVLSRGDGTAAREYVLLRPDGAETPIEERHAAIRDTHGVTVGTIVTFHDITSRKAIEAEREALLQSERRARERADVASRLKDEFLATISHELRTPATGILGWARLLKTGRMDAAQTHQALDALERGAHAQAKLLEDLLDVSRIVRGALRIDLEATDVREVLDAAVETIAPAMHAKEIQFAIDMPPELPRVQADPDRLRQVFWNLLSNAVKFTEPGGAIRVSARLAAGRLQVEVVDSGHGIEQDALPFVFDRFRQADGSTTRPHGGLGLGLAIVRHLVELHGGTVAAHSEGRGKGARFEIGLPIAAGERVASATALRDAVS